MNTPDTKYPLIRNTIDSFKSLIGYDLSTLRVVFEHEGDEIVFINELWIGRVRIYLNGSLAYSGWDWTVMMFSTGQFLHKGKTYKIRSVIINLLTCDQKVTLSVNSEAVDIKTDEMFGRLTWRQAVHSICGAMLVGALGVGLLSMLGL